MPDRFKNRVSKSVALHPEGVDRNIRLALFGGRIFCVALHPEGVDRNQASGGKSVIEYVALHPEGVDRNSTGGRRIDLCKVALHPEGVDRNSPRF